MRRAGCATYRVSLHDISPFGCRVEFIDRPSVNEKVWIKFEGLESIEGTVCWVKGIEAGVKFERPLHPVIFELLVSRLG